MSPTTRKKTPRWLLVSIGLVLALLICQGVFVYWDRSRVDPRLSRAQLGCAQLTIAIEAYMNNPSCAGGHEDGTREPKSLRDLVYPPFGGPPLLRFGEADLLDPWGNPYQMEHIKRKDGTEYILITTTAPDGTPISQFGIGKNASPRME
jgi:hypothetical protein